MACSKICPFQKVRRAYLTMCNYWESINYTIEHSCIAFFRFSPLLMAIAICFVWVSISAYSSSEMLARHSGSSFRELMANPTPFSSTSGAMADSFHTMIGNPARR